MIYQLEAAGIEAFDVRTPAGAYAGLLVQKRDGVKLAFNASGTRASARRFPDMMAALEYMHARREKRGMNRKRAA